MEILIYFTLFAMIGGEVQELGKLRQRVSPNVKKMSNIINDCKKDHILYNMLYNQDYSNIKIISGTVKENVKQITELLKTINGHVTSQIFQNFENYLEKYCQIVYAFVNDFINFDISVDRLYLDNIIQTIKLDAKLECCIITYFYDNGKNVENILEVMIFLQSLEHHSGITTQSIVNQLSKIYKGKEINDELITKFRDIYDPDKKISNAAELLKEIKLNIYNLSQPFCKEWKSLIKPSIFYRRLFYKNDKDVSKGNTRTGNQTMAENKKEQIKFPTEYIEYVFTKQFCEVTVSIPLFIISLTFRF